MGAGYGDAGESDREGSHLRSLSAASSLHGDGCSKADHPSLALAWPDPPPPFQTWKARLAAPDISSALLHWPWAPTHLSCKGIFQWGSLPPQPVPAGQPPRPRIRCISTQFSAPLSLQQGSPALCKGQPFSLRLHTSQHGELTTFQGRDNFQPVYTVITFSFANFICWKYFIHNYL